MLTTSIAFLAGVLMMAGIMYGAGARFSVALYVAGVVSVAAPLVALLSSVARIRAAARFLSAFAQGLEARGGTLKPIAVPDKSGYVKPSKKAQLQQMADAVEEYRERSSTPGAGYSKTTDAVLADMFGEGRVA
jgi:hypothetical protein